MNVDATNWFWYTLIKEHFLQALHIEGSTEDERRNPERLLCLNLIFQFLFQETKDTKQFRK